MRMQVPCDKCGSSNDVEMVPPRITNTEHCTVLVFEHTGRFACNKCLVPLALVVRGVGQIGFVLGTIQAPASEATSLIVPAQSLPI